MSDKKERKEKKLITYIVLTDTAVVVGWLYQEMKNYNVSLGIKSIELRMSIIMCNSYLIGGNEISLLESHYLP